MSTIPDLRQRIADEIDRLYDAGAIYAIEDSERDALAAALLPLFAKEREAGFRDGQAQTPDESVNVVDPPVSDELRGGFWPNMTGGMCATCHVAVNRDDEPDPAHSACTVINDGMRISAAPARPDEVLLHLPHWTYWDTQAYSGELGLPIDHLPALKAVIDAWLSQRAVNVADGDGR